MSLSLEVGRCGDWGGRGREGGHKVRSAGEHETHFDLSG